MLTKAASSGKDLPIMLPRSAILVILLLLHAFPKQQVFQECEA